MADPETTEAPPELTKAEKKAAAKAAALSGGKVESSSTLEGETSSPRVTRGRIVDYHHQENDGVVDLSAIVTNVACIRPDMMVVCLTVFDSIGTTFGTTGVKEGTGPGEWSWPERS